MGERLMKTSGVDYIDVIPNNWKITKIKYIVSTPVITGAGEEAQDKNENSIRYIRISDFDKDGNIDNEKAAYIPFIKGYKYLIEKGDILAATAGGTVGKTLLFKGLNEVACYAGYLAKIRTDLLKMDNRFLLYQMRSQLMDDFRTCVVKKSTIENISASTYSNMCVIYPSINEQKKIADYLDSKCYEIDNLTKDIECQIRILDEYKKSVITEAITKGLDSNVEMKDTGFQYWQSIPSNWILKDIKYIFEIVKRIAGKEGYDVISVTQKGLKFKDIDSNEGQIAADYSGYQFVYPNDYVMNHMDLLTGWVDCSTIFGVTSPDYRVFRLRDKSKNSLEYYKYVLQSCYFNKVFYSLGAGVANLGRWRLQTDAFNNFLFPVPPTNEQQQIADYLNTKCSEIDSIISDKNNQLDTLAKYKKSLIYEYVTGKKEVA